MIGLLVSILGTPGSAAAQQEAPAEVWRVVTKESPPFAHKDASGDWRGLAIELAEEIADELEVRLELSEAATVEEMLARVEAGQADAAISAISVTPEREQRVDFSHPYFASGLGVAVRAKGGGGSWLVALVHGVTSRAFLELLAMVLLIVAGAGLLFWLAEHRHHPQFKEGGTRSSMGTGFWWSTIILFGHKGIFPKTVVGSILAATGMLLSVLLLSVLTGAIASTLTLNQLETSIHSVEDLRKVRTVAVGGTSSQTFLETRRVDHRAVPTPREGLDLVARDEADAIVYDAPLLRYSTRQDHPGIRVLDRTFDLQDYAIAFQLDSDWRKPVNQALLSIRSGEAWADTLFRYLGR